MRKDQRRHSRVKCAGSVELYFVPGEPPDPATIVNLSVEGCLVKLRLPRTSLAESSVIEVAFVVKQLPFRVRGRLKGLRFNELVGIHFDALRDRTRSHLLDLVDKLAPSSTEKPDE